MIFLKILGITLAVIVILIIILLLSRAKIIIGYAPDTGILFRIKYLFFTLYDNKKPKKKKDNKKKRFDISAILKKKLGLELDDESLSDEEKAKKSIYEKVSTVVLLVTVLSDEFVWLFKRLRLDRLHVIAICSGDDAAESATDYGLVCAAVYPLVGYLMGNINAKKGAEDVQIGCDFDGNGYFECEITVSVRLMFIIRTLIKSLGDLMEVAQDVASDDTNDREKIKK